MRVIIAGSRTISEYSSIKEAVEKSNFHIGEIVSGGANGADKLGELYARINGIKCKIFPVEWNKYGKSAGYIRNAMMGEYADALIAIWDSYSKGTKHMINIMKKLNKPVYVYIFDEGN